MKSFDHKYFLLILVFCFSLSYPHPLFADITLPWSTTYNCADWDHYNPPPNCDGLTHFGGDFCSTDTPSKEEQITAAANMSTGAGGKGQRHWIGDGNNVMTGGTQVIFTSDQNEIWMRFYMRFPSGFYYGANGPGDYKIIYIDPLTSLRIALEFADYANDVMQLYSWNTGQHSESAYNTGWQHIMGGKYGDGLWHCYEMHIKMDTNGTDGIGEVWVDGVKIINVHNANWVNGGSTKIHSLVIGHNGRTPANGKCMPVDFDDVAINNTGYIGPVGGSVTHNVTCSVASYGSCSCNSPVNNGVTTTCTATPNSGYQIASGSSACGGSLSGNAFMTGAVTSDCAVTFTTSTPAVVNGACGVANGQSFTSAPTANLCSSGTASSVSGTGPWTWTCNGSGGGTNASCSASVLSQTALFQENFDDNSFASRGWYDVTGGTIKTIEHISGSTGSLECRFLQGGTNCTGGIPGRMAFTATDQVYLSYWVKHSSNWQGSGLTKPYHPHIIYFLTNLDGAYTGPAYTYMTAYVEENLGYPMLATQDGKNIDETKIGLNLVGVTENRSTAGCNGTQTGIGQSNVSCYVMGAVHWNYTEWRGSTAYFFDANEKILWHHVEAYLKLNSISGGTGQPDGILRYWYDGQLVVDHNNVIMKTAKNPTMQFNQIMLSPYIGDGSPVDQTFWIDNLTVATSRTSDTMPPKWPGNVR